MEEIVLEVFCVICKKSMKPSETDMLLFRLGYHVHNEETNPDCISTLAVQAHSSSMRSAAPMQK